MVTNYAKKKDKPLYCRVPSKKEEAAMTYTIAVYGTLREGFWNYESFLLPHLQNARAKFVLKTKVRNFKLYLQKWPLIYPTDVSTDSVVVEIYKVTPEVFENIKSMEENFKGSPYKASMLEIQDIGWACTWVMSKQAYLQKNPKAIPPKYKGDFYDFYKSSTEAQYRAFS